MALGKLEIGQDKFWVLPPVDKKNTPLIMHKFEL